jgi:DNA-binding MarR family transcriptional regulator
MNHNTIPATFYLSLLTFLLHNKHKLIEISATAGLTPMQAFTLLLTDNDHPKPMAMFGKLFDCDASNVTGIVDGLEHKGLVKRAEHPTDRRIKVIRLQPAGEALRLQLTEKLVDSGDSFLAGLDDAEAQTFVKLIDKLSRHITAST